MQEREREEFLTRSDFGHNSEVPQCLIDDFNGHTMGDAGRKPFYYSDGEVQRRGTRKKETPKLFKGYNLNQLTIVKSGVYAAGEKTTGNNYKGGYLKDNAVITRYIDPETGVWKQTRDGRWPYRLLTNVGYHFFNVRKVDTYFKSGDVISLPVKFDRLNLKGDRKRREISRLENILI